ncbi:MAG: alpha/beta hydrolase, partial [Planctomycetota bacterium]|nr:alpha/beta hydrolase [Planctomycetota bacterium]
MLGFLLVGLLTVSQVPPLPEGIASRERDIIYGRKYGLSLTMDRFTPTKPNGKAVIWVVSGGWFSNPDSINSGFVTPLCRAGYQVFAVCHGSQPRFT